jgi:L-lactate dehydrogenase
VIVVSNPVDVLTYLAVKRTGLPWQRIIGLGTVLDTARFRSNLAKKLQVPATQVGALILGEHGDSMVPIWSSATIAGLPLEQWPGFDATTAKEIFDATKGAGAQVIKQKGGAGFAVGLSIREVVHAIALDSRRVLPVSSLVNGPYGISDVCLSIPTEIGCGGVRKQIELALTPKERLGLQNSARVLRVTIDQVNARLASGASGPSSKPAQAHATVASKTAYRAIPRAAWLKK